jgi:DNA modification methylase
MNAVIMQGDVLEKLRTLPAESIHCCVTSPPYWGLRDYGTARWEGGRPGCDHLNSHGAQGKTGQRADRTFTGAQNFYREICRKCGAVRIDHQIGFEKTPEEWCARLVEVFREVRRVLRKDGTCWINLGDCYASGGRGGNPTHASSTLAGGLESQEASMVGRSMRPGPGYKPKDLIGQPWMLAFALRADGWYLRQDIIWSKPSPMPESVRDRCTKSHEYLFLLSKSQRYYWDPSAMQEAASGNVHPRGDGRNPKCAGSADAGSHSAKDHARAKDGLRDSTKFGRRAGWRNKQNASFSGSVADIVATRNRRSVWSVSSEPFSGSHFATYPVRLIEPCILAGCPARGVVLDPFSGSGTSGIAALKHGRCYLGIELKPENVAMSLDRIRHAAPLLNDVRVSA